MPSPVYSQQFFDVGANGQQAFAVGDVGPVDITFLEIVTYPPYEVIPLAFNSPVIADVGHFLPG